MKCYEENGNANTFYLNCIFKTPFSRVPELTLARKSIWRLLGEMNST
jgi:hypothetical protein